MLSEITHNAEGRTVTPMTIIPNEGASKPNSVRLNTNTLYHPMQGPDIQRDRTSIQHDHHQAFIAFQVLKKHFAGSKPLKYVLL